MKVALSISLGVLIAAANYFAIAYIAKGLICRDDGRLKFGLLAGLKSVLLITVFFVLVKWSAISIVALLAGFTAALLLLIIFLPGAFKHAKGCGLQ